MATLIIGGLLAAAMFFAIRYIHRQHKGGRCAGGCAGCSGCCHLKEEEFAQMQEAVRTASDGQN